MEAHKQEQQEILQRHLKFIDRLMADKKELSDKCDTLSSELQERDNRTNDKLKDVSDQHARYLFAKFARDPASNAIIGN
jgi:5-azacytidine-induced protein 1